MNIPNDFWVGFSAEIASSIFFACLVWLFGYLAGYKRIKRWINKLVNHVIFEITFPNNQKVLKISPSNSSNDYDFNLNFFVNYINEAPISGKKDLHVYIPDKAILVSGDAQIIDKKNKFNHFVIEIPSDINPGISTKLNTQNQVFRFEKYNSTLKEFEIYYYLQTGQGYFPDNLNDFLESNKELDFKLGGKLTLRLLRANKA